MNNNDNNNNNLIIAGGLSWTLEEIEEIHKDIDKQKIIVTKNERED